MSKSSEKGLYFIQSSGCSILDTSDLAVIPSEVMYEIKSNSLCFRAKAGQN